MKTSELTIVLLPGLNGTTGLFDPLIKASNGECKILPISYPTHTPKSYGALTELVEQKLYSIEGNYVLIGESFSGPISIMLTAKNLRGHIGTILVATFCTAPNIRIVKHLPWTFGFYVSKPFYSLISKCGGSKSSPSLRSIAIEMNKVCPRVLASRMKSIFSIQAENLLGSCTLPMAYFRGDFDFFVPKRNMEKVVVINSKVAVFNFRTRHFILQSVPYDAWEAILRFSKKCIQEIINQQE
ncbi:MAG: hypothetical protein ACJA2B_000890 [Candidatus Endobugula sp.]|jgi:hypothetical protein